MAKQEEQVSGQEQLAEAGGSLLDSVIQATGPYTQKDEATEMVRALVDQATKGAVKFDKDLVRSIKAGVAAIDQVISKQLGAIMHAPEFQKLEGTWRGLHYLVSNSETGPQMKIRVLNCPKKDLAKDMERAIEFDQSTLFKKIYTEEFDQAGGAPYSALIGDYEFTSHNDDIALLEKVSGVSAAAFAPFLTAPSSELFGMKSWEELAGVRDLSMIFESKEYIKWKAFRETEDSRFVTMCMPRTLARLPYGAATKPIEEFAFEEVPLGKKGEPVEVSHDQYCWMNTAYVMGTKLTDAFAKYGWCTAIRGAENGGRVDGLPVHVFKSMDGDLAVKCPTEVMIPGRRENELSNLGFLPLCYYKDKDYAVFFGGQTAQKPKKYDRSDATENAAISARLPYIMATARIAHYLQVIARDKIGSFMEKDDCAAWLNRWIHNYVSADDKPSAEAKARYPLAAANIEVTEVPGKPGAYNAVALLRPWLQLEELSASLRLVARIPQKS